MGVIRDFRAGGLAGISVGVLMATVFGAAAQTTLPQITVTEPKAVQHKKAPTVQRRAQQQQRPTVSAVPQQAKSVPGRAPLRRMQVATRHPSAPAVRSATNGAPQGPAAPVAAEQSGDAGPNTPAAAQERAFTAAQNRVLTKTGTSVTGLDRTAIQALPQGDNQPFDKAILQLPGVVQDSAASGDFHVRNEHANVQYRINGVLLPDGVSGFGQFLDTSLVGRVNLVTGALPAEYGLHTAGLLDIQTRDGAFDNGAASASTAVVAARSNRVSPMAGASGPRIISSRLAFSPIHSA